MTPPPEDRTTLFEISWEVGHKVGGIHTVVTTKARSLAEHFAKTGGEHVMVGPWLLDHRDAEAGVIDEPRYEDFVAACRRRGLPVRVGRWDIPGRPLTILVEFSSLYERKDELLADLWAKHRVDSLFGDWGYLEPVLFGLAAAEVVELWWHEVARGHGRGVVQAHEWMTGSALLHALDHVPELGTVFTTHATVLGRGASELAQLPVDALGDDTPEELAERLNRRAPHSMEGVAARKADVFTAVSELASEESRLFHDRAADPVVPNGIDAVVLAERVGDTTPEQSRAALLDLASRFLGEPLPDDTRLLAAGARYEFHNKGLDVVLDALARLPEDGPPVVLFLLVPAGNSGLRKELVARLATDAPPSADDLRPPLGISLQTLFDLDDPIATRCAELGLTNAHGSRVRIVHWADYVEPGDGLLDRTYEAVLSGTDLTLFPSLYEPWGYTPLESLALGVPTVSTDCAGFALWARDRGFGEADGLFVLSRAHRTDEEVTAELFDVVRRVVVGETEFTAESCRAVAAAASWTDLVGHHLDAVERAAQAGAARRHGSRAPSFRALRRVAGDREGARAEPRLFELEVATRIPRRLDGLVELAWNWCWIWNPDAWALFEQVDPVRWSSCRHDPLVMLHGVDPEALTERLADEDYLTRLDRVVERTRAYLAERAPASDVTPDRPVAYVCAEYGLHESLPLYSGGLGVLAGDHLRSASDLGIPLVAVGLLYRGGYMRQELVGGVTQVDTADGFDPDRTALTLVRDDHGDPVEVRVQLPGAPVRLRIWRADVGRVPLYLLDSDVEGNRAEHRELTARLYAGDHEHRLRQELVLGIGGARALSAVGIEPSVFHVNEGHGAFVALERVRALLRETDLTFDECRGVVRSTTVFTTHTPVAAGHDAFGEELMRRHFADVQSWLGIEWDEFLALGASAREPGRFSMTGLAFRFAHAVNGVSAKHAEVSQELLRAYCPQLLAGEVPVFHVTNGVHLSQWTAPEIVELLGAEPGRPLGDAFRRAEELDALDLWKTRERQRARFRVELESRLRRTFARRNDDPAVLEEVVDALVPDALVIGFARRFATYKRAALLLRDPDRLERILSDPERPVRIYFAGKAHPRDKQGQALLAELGTLARTDRFRGRLVVLQGYDIELARLLLHGVDVWLNTPRPPMEASGTSGMKASANGALNLSVADGWWLEGYDGTNGWCIGDPQGVGYREFDPEVLDSLHAADLYRLLETEVVPSFFDRDADGLPQRWLQMVRRSMATVPPQFDTQRMVAQYDELAYRPLARAHAELRPNRYARTSELWADRHRTRRALHQVRIRDLTVGDTSRLRSGDALEARATVDLGPLDVQDVAVELVFGRRNGDDGLRDLRIVRLAAAGVTGDGAHTFTGSLDLPTPGDFGYAVRVRPTRNDRPDGNHRPGPHDPVVWA